jgi:hypothetical protein
MTDLLPILLFLFQAPGDQKLATLEGTVLHAASKTPIRKAKVTLTPIGGGDANASVETGDDGKFVLKDVQPGRYRINAEKAGYENTAYGARRPGEALGQVLRVDAGGALSRLDIAVPKHGVIAGKVLDADNEPVSRALVIALGNAYVNGRRQRIPRGSVPVMSNDLGEFRIGELPPGKYILCAIPFSFIQPSAEIKESKPRTEEAYASTCYPNLPMKDATPIEIRDSSEVPGTDVRLTRVKMVSVQGRIAGVPPGAGAITILNLNTPNSGPMGNAIHPRALVQTADGRFDFKNVPPGDYVLHTLPTGLGNAPFIVKTNVHVGDQPIENLEVHALAPFEVKAKIVAEPSPELKIGSIRMVLTPADDVTSSLAMGTANAEGDLTLGNLAPGRYRVQFTGLPQTHYVREIRAGDQVAADDEIDIPNATTPVSVHFALGKAEISGVAQDEKGEPVVGAHVGLVPDPRRQFRLRAARTDQNGMFRFANVPPGDYQILALDSVEPGSLQDDEFLKPLRSKMKKVRVDEGGSQSFQLTVLPAQPEQ